MPGISHAAFPTPEVAPWFVWDEARAEQVRSDPYMRQTNMHDHQVYAAGILRTFKRAELQSCVWMAVSSVT